MNEELLKIENQLETQARALRKLQIMLLFGFMLKITLVVVLVFCVFVYALPYIQNVYVAPIVDQALDKANEAQNIGNQLYELGLRLERSCAQATDKIFYLNTLQSPIKNK